MMGALLSYSILGGLTMLAMYLGYRVFLARNNQHAFNRNVLLIIYFVSFVLVPVAIPFVNSESVAVSPTGLTVAINEMDERVATSPKYPWGTVLIWIYICGMIVVTVKTASTRLKLATIIRSGTKIYRDGYTLVLTDKHRFAPFSWMNYIVINSKDYESDCSAITAHEYKHVVSHHWIDLLIAQAVCIINWFNPAAWLMRDELMLVHEYQADMAVIESGHDAKQYQMLLIKKAVGSRFPSLANSLNHSKLKKRITMMYKEKSGAGRKLSALALVPMLALALGVASVPPVRAAVSTISNSEVSVGKGSENLSNDKTNDELSIKVINLNSDGREITVKIKGENLGNNLTVSGGELIANNKSYSAKAMNCDMANGTAVINVVFPYAEGYDKSKMTLMINGEKKFFDLNNSAQNPTSDINFIASKTLDSMEIFLNGKKISSSEIKNISAESITSVDIDKKNHTMIITTK